MQKLSPEAKKKKAVRDLAYAKTDDRRIKKAHSQRMHRKHPGNNGKDYDHEDSRFESVKQNRGNEGEGTKKEIFKTDNEAITDFVYSSNLFKKIRKAQNKGDL